MVAQGSARILNLMSPLLEDHESWCKFLLSIIYKGNMNFFFVKVTNITYHPYVFFL
jgi:hypothetical protein